MVQANAPGNGGGNQGGNNGGPPNPFFPLGVTGVLEIHQLKHDSDKKARQIFLKDLGKKDPLWFLFGDPGEIAIKIDQVYTFKVTLEDIQSEKVKLRKRFHKENVSDAEL